MHSFFLSHYLPESTQVDGCPFFLNSFIGCDCDDVPNCPDVLKLKKGEYGRAFYLNAGEDIAMATQLIAEFTKPNGDVVQVAAVLGGIDVSSAEDCCDAVFKANEYAVFVLPEGLVDQAGRWCVRLLAPSSVSSVPGDAVAFQVSC